MIRAQRPVSITSLVAIPLLLFLGVLLLMSILLFFTFRDINAVLSQTVEEKTPFIMHATALIRQSEGLRSMVFRLMQADSYLVWNSLVEQVRTRLAEGLENARSLRELGLYPSKVENLQRQMESLSSVVAGTNSFMARWLHVSSARTQLIKSLHSLNGDMEDLAGRQPLIADWHRRCRLLAETLLTLSTPMDMSYALRLKADVQSLRRQADTALRRLPIAALPERERATLVRMHLLLMDYTDNDGIVRLFDEARELNRQYAEMSIEIDALSESISISAGDLMQNVNAELADIAGDISGRMEEHALIIILSVLTVFLTCYIAYRHFFRKVVQPVLSLYNFLRLRASDRPARIRCDDGALEVREVARALSYFLTTLEERERELRESHANLENQVSERTAELRKLSQRLLQTREEERFRLAAELHDDIGATVSVIKLGIERALHMLARQGQSPEAQAPLKEAIDLIRGMARQLRRIQYDLRPAHLDVGFLPSLHWFCEGWLLANSRIALSLQLDIGEEDIPIPLRIVLFPLVQEGLNNVARHSQARQTEICISRTAEELRMSLADDGCGFVLSDAGDGNGLRNMRERVELSGGVFRIESAPGRGTRILAVWEMADLACA